MKENSKSNQTQKRKRAKTVLLQIIILVGWVSLSIMISTVIMQLAFSWAIQTFHIGTGTLVQSLFSTLIYALSLFICLYFPAKIGLSFYRKKQEITYDLKFGKTDRETLGLRGLPTWTDILLSPIGFIAQLLLSLVVTSAFTIFPWFNANEAQETGYSDLITPQDRILAFFVICIVAPIIEEIIFRGFLYGKLRENLDLGKKYDKFNLPLSILVTSILFGIMHGQWNVGVNVFSVSIILCILREMTGSIYCGMLVHILKNTLAFWILFIYQG